MTTTTIVTKATKPANEVPKLTLLSDTGERVRLPFAPIEGPLTNLAAGWAEVPRNGRRAPLLVYVGPQLANLQLEATVVDVRNPDQSAELYVYTLTRLARSTRRVWVINYGSLVGNAWQITDFGATPFRRQPGTNAVSGFTASLTLKATSDTLRLSPMTPKDFAHYGIATAKTVTVRPGESASAVAARVLGSASRMGALLDRNGIRDPRAVYAGQVLEVP